MDFYSDGQNAKKLFKKIDDERAFHMHITTIFKENKNVYEAYDFLRGFLHNTKSHISFLFAIKVAEMDMFRSNSETLWGYILLSFNALIKSKNKPKWAYSVVNNILRTSSLKLFNYDIEKLVYLVFKYDDKYSDWWFDYIKLLPWFGKNKQFFKDAILTHKDNLDIFSISRILQLFPDLYFYKNLMQGKNILLLTSILSFISVSKINIESFYKSKSVNELITDFEDRIVDNQTALFNMADIIKKYNDQDTIKLFLQLVEKSKVDVKNKIEILKVISSLDYKEVNIMLFSLTKDEKYLTQEVVDIFIF